MTAMCLYIHNFVFVVVVVVLEEMGFLHVGQADVEILTSGDLPTSASQSATITGMSHGAQPQNIFLDMMVKSLD